MKKKTKILVISFLCFALLSLVLTICISAHVTFSSRERILTPMEAGALDDVDYILVLGCGLRDDGSPSDMLSDRISTALDLHFSTEIPLLASGDHSRPDYDEVGAVASVAKQAGVDEKYILLDHAGFSTYESMYRAKEVFGAKKVIIVTHRYHLYRAIYIARALGMDAYGISADRRSYRGQLYRDVREFVACVKDFFAVRIKPKPLYMGDGLPY